MNLRQGEFRILQSIVTRALEESSRTLARMTAGRIRLQPPHISFLPLSAVPGIAGGPAEVVCAVYLGIKGDLSGHLMLLFGKQSACRLVDLLLERPESATAELDEIAVSALAETANICGAAFMNAIADRTGLKVVPTAPAVVVDMAGAILQSVVAELYLSGDEVLVVETGVNGQVSGHFVLMPDNPSMARLIAALEAIP